MTLERIDHQQRLYVVKAGEGYSCLGFDFARARCNAVALWLKSPNLGMSAADGTVEAYKQYSKAMKAGAEWNEKTGERCMAEIHPKLEGFLGKRVEVTSNGERSRFRVGRSMGWMPVLLRLPRSSPWGDAISFSETFDSVVMVR